MTHDEAIARAAELRRERPGATLGIERLRLNDPGGGYRVVERHADGSTTELAR